MKPNGAHHAPSIASHASRRTPERARGTLRLIDSDVQPVDYVVPAVGQRPGRRSRRPFPDPESDPQSGPESEQNQPAEDSEGTEVDPSDGESPHRIDILVRQLRASRVELADPAFHTL